MLFLVRSSAIVLLSLAMTQSLAAAEWETSELGQTAVVPMESAPFPHPSRADGYTYKETVYPADKHYSDNSVLLFIPAGYVPGPETDLLFYFHGWGNNVRKATETFSLREQIVRSRRNVILVFPEGPVDASDSGLGKLEDKDGLRNLADETLRLLNAEGKIPATKPGRVVIAGHSGAYRGIAFCLEQGGMEEEVSEVYLLDAAYANLDFIGGWMTRRPDARLRSIFTAHLAGDNATLMSMLSVKDIPFAVRLDTDLAADESVLDSQRFVFVYTENLDHNQTVSVFETFLKHGGLGETNRGD